MISAWALFLLPNRMATRTRTAQSAHKRRKQHDDRDGGQQDEPADIFEATAGSEDSPAEPEEPEDYYLPAERPPDEE
jgi:hypothetical protein